MCWSVSMMMETGGFWTGEQASGQLDEHCQPANIRSRSLTLYRLDASVLSGHVQAAVVASGRRMRLVRRPGGERGHAAGYTEARQRVIEPARLLRAHRGNEGAWLRPRP
jgi:hypothetical protein